MNKINLEHNIINNKYIKNKNYQYFKHKICELW